MLTLEAAPPGGFTKPKGLHPLTKKADIKFREGQERWQVGPFLFPLGGGKIVIDKQLIYQWTRANPGKTGGQYPFLRWLGDRLKETSVDLRKWCPFEHKNVEAHHKSWVPEGTEKYWWPRQGGCGEGGTWPGVPPMFGDHKFKPVWSYAGWQFGAGALGTDPRKSDQGWRFLGQLDGSIPIASVDHPRAGIWGERLGLYTTWKKNRIIVELKPWPRGWLGELWHMLSSVVSKIIDGLKALWDFLKGLFDFLKGIACALAMSKLKEIETQLTDEKKTNKQVASATAVFGFNEKKVAEIRGGNSDSAVKLANTVVGRFCDSGPPIPGSQDLTPWYKKPTTWGLIAGGVLIAGGGAYYYGTRR